MRRTGWRIPYGAIDWATLGRLDFEVPDLGTFPCLALAYEAGRRAAPRPRSSRPRNEVAVEAFLAGRIAWTEIAEVVDEVLNGGTGNADEIADVLEADRRARERAAASSLARSAA